MNFWPFCRFFYLTSSSLIDDKTNENEIDIVDEKDLEKLKKEFENFVANGNGEEKKNVKRGSSKRKKRSARKKQTIESNEEN